MKRTIFILLLLSIQLDVKSQSQTPTNIAWNASQSECEFKGFALNTIFNLPIVRYNIMSLDASKHHELGNLEYFNSVGAGISISWGKIHIRERNGQALTNNTFDDDRIVTMKNVIGLSAGLLISKNDSTGAGRIIFTPNVNLQILDFQLGYGYELGTVKNSAHRSVFTLTYGIPLSKFSNVGSYLFNNKNRSLNVQGLF